MQMRNILLFLSFVLFLNQSLALSPLPRNSYLRLGDNQKEVKILQQILNSDPDTLVDKSGVGSPGKENWYFGSLTEKALMRFQEKNNLEVTGRIDFKTWKKLNDYVLGISEITPRPSLDKEGSNADTDSISSKIQSANEKRLSINEQNKKDFEEAKKLKAEKAKEEAVAKTEESKSYIQSLLDKYTGFFYTSKGDAGTEKPTTNPASSTQDIYSNNYSVQTPYLNPSTGIYSSNPTYSQQPQQPAQPISNNFASQPGLNPFLPQQQNPYLNYGLQPTAVPVIPGSEQSAGQVNGTSNEIGQGEASSFAHETLARGCTADIDDQQNNQRSASGVILSRAGVPAIPAVALRISGRHGTAVEVKDLSTGKCKAFPLLDFGPAVCKVNGTCTYNKKPVVIDLTGSAIDILKGNAPCKNVASPPRTTNSGIPKVQYAVISGDKIQPGQTKECTHLVKQN